MATIGPFRASRDRSIAYHGRMGWKSALFEQLPLVVRGRGRRRWRRRGNEDTAFTSGGNGGTGGAGVSGAIATPRARAAASAVLAILGLTGFASQFRNGGPAEAKPSTKMPALGRS